MGNGSARAVPLQLGQRTPYGIWEACELRVELEQLGAGELVGIGSIVTVGAPPPPATSEVIVSGLLAADGTATLELVPVTDAGHGALTLRVRVVIDPRTEDPTVVEVLEVARRRGRRAARRAMPAR